VRVEGYASHVGGRSSEVDRQLGEYVLARRCNDDGDRAGRLRCGTSTVHGVGENYVRSQRREFCSKHWKAFKVIVGEALDDINVLSRFPTEARKRCYERLIDEAGVTATLRRRGQDRQSWPGALGLRRDSGRNEQRRKKENTASHRALGKRLSLMPQRVNCEVPKQGHCRTQNAAGRYRSTEEAHG
jgi:hypothetical protein